MKTIQKRWLPLFLLAAVTILFPACEKDKSSVEGGGSENRTYTSVLLPYTMGIEYAYGGTAGNAVIIKKGTMSFLSKFASDANGYVDKAQFICMGSMNSIEQIKSVPSENWQNDNISLDTGKGYLVRFHYAKNNRWFYRRIYIHDYFEIGGVESYYHIQYDYSNWDPLSVL